MAPIVPWPEFSWPPVGEWYSFPPASFCPVGTEIGTNGCTWRLSPVSHSISLGKIMQKGVFARSALAGEAQAVAWAKLGQAAFAEIGAQPCGGSDVLNGIEGVSAETILV